MGDFSATHSAFAYNETVMNEYLPLPRGGFSTRIDGERKMPASIYQLVAMFSFVLTVAKLQLIPGSGAFEVFLLLQNALIAGWQLVRLRNNIKLHVVAVSVAA